MTGFVLIASLIAVVLVYVATRPRSGATGPATAARWFIVPEGASDDVQRNYAGVLAIHAALLPTGQIIYFGGDEHDPALWQNNDVDHTRLFDCATLHVEGFNPGSPPGSPPTDLFCCGHAMLGDGKLLVAGGTEFFFELAPGTHHHEHMPGLRDASVYDPFARAWTRIDSMIDPFPGFPNPKHDGRPEGGRWYPTLLTIHDGSILALCGHPSNQDVRHNNHIPERYVPFLGSWIALPEPSPLFEISDDTRLYPRVHLLPNGTVFCSTPLGTEHRSQTIDPMTGLRRFAGAAPPRDTVSGDLALTGPFGNAIDMQNGVYWGNGFTQCATSVLLPLEPPHYAPRVLICGGRKAHVIDLQAITTDPAAQPPWNPTGLRANEEPRFHLNAVLMPTGDVFVSGGCRKFNQDRTADNVPEIYHSETNDWESLSDTPARVTRNYHSVALLMPDGRIWTAGSDRDGGQGFASAELRIEIFEPDYFARADRPRIGSAPDTVMCGDSFDIETPDAASIGRVAIIRAGSVTHSFNSDQRYVGLDFRRSGDARLSVTAPPNGRIAPPGSYLLFLLNTDGVPSAGQFVRIGMHQQHVFYRDVRGGIEHIFWDEPTSHLYADNWTARTGEIAAAGNPATMVTPDQQHVFYRATDGSIRHIFWDARPRQLFHDNWTQRSGAPLAFGDPATMVTPHQQHIFYRTRAGAIHHVLWDDRTPNGFFHDDWTARAGAPLAAGDPVTMVTPHQQHIFYRTVAGAIHHVLWDDRTVAGFFHDDWTARAGAPLAAGDPATMITPHQQHIFFRTQGDAIHHILWDDRNPGGFFHDDWTARAGAPLAADDPATMITPHQQHIFYRTQGGAMHHILWDDRTKGGFFHDDWTARAKAPVPVAGPATMVTPHQQHIFYQGRDGTIEHILWDGWTEDFFRDEWTALTGATRAAGRPVTMVTRV
ncbi:MAG: galactose oxidase-like domain-containing protein [Gemmatimonadaceae bacterium]